MKSDHDLFTNAVRNVLPQYRFFPAELGGRKVKQLVQMPFQFTLNKSPEPEQD
jgi:periplasmic protein TonB